MSLKERDVQLDPEETLGIGLDFLDSLSRNPLIPKPVKKLLPKMKKIITIADDQAYLEALISQSESNGVNGAIALKSAEAEVQTHHGFYLEATEDFPYGQIFFKKSYLSNPGALPYVSDLIAEEVAHAIGARRDLGTLDEIRADSMVLFGFNNHQELLKDIQRACHNPIHIASPPATCQEVQVHAIGFFTKFTNSEGIGLPILSAHQVFEEARAALLETMFLIAEWGSNTNNPTISYKDQIRGGFSVLKHRTKSSADYSTEHRAAGVIWEYLENKMQNEKPKDAFHGLITILTRNTLDEFLNLMKEIKPMNDYFFSLLDNRKNYVYGKRS